MTWTTTMRRMVWRASSDPLITWAVRVGAGAGTPGGGIDLPAGGAAGRVLGLGPDGETLVWIPRNSPNGLAGLDEDGTLPDSRIPAPIARDTEVAAAIGAALAALTLASSAVTQVVDDDEVTQAFLNNLFIGEIGDLADLVAGDGRSFTATLRVHIPIGFLGGSWVDGTHATIGIFASVPDKKRIWLQNQSGGADGLYLSDGAGGFTLDVDPLDPQYLGSTVTVGVDLEHDNGLTVWATRGTESGVVAQRFDGQAVDDALAAVEDLVDAEADARAAKDREHNAQLQAVTEAFRRTGGHGQRLTFPGNTVGRLSTPALGDVFTAGYEVRSVIRPLRPSSGSRWLEVGGQSDDGTGALDCHEPAIFRGDPAFGYLADAMYLFAEFTQVDTTGEVANRLNGLLAAQWGMDVEIMVRVDFGTTTVTGWERVPYALADGATYVTSSIDGAVFRLVATVTDPGYDSIKASEYDWWIGNNFLGSWQQTVWRNGADGALVDDVRATDIAPGDTEFVSTGGYPWTIGAGVTLTLDAENRLTALEAAVFGP